MGNTMGLDMGNSFHFIPRPFEGHVMEDSLLCGATVGVRKVGFEGPTKHVAIVSVVPDQPKEWLQMEAAFRRRGPTGTVGSDTSSPSLASANGWEMVETNSTAASAASELGKSQIESPIGAGLCRSKSSDGPDDRTLAQTNETQSPGSAALSAWATDELGKVDGGSWKQSRMDSGFQRMVSDARRPSSGTADGAGFVQPVFAEHPIASRSKVGASAANLSAIVQRIWLSPSDSRGQRQSLWIDRPGGAFALERLVEGHGNWGGIHCSRPSRTKRRTRANASNDEGGSNFVQPSCAATPDGSMDVYLQPCSSSRRLEPAAPGGGISSAGTAIEERSIEISTAVGNTSGQEQWPDQMARTKTLCGRSSGWISRRAQADGREEMDSLFRHSAHRGTVGARRGWYASGQVYSWPVRRWTGPRQKDQPGSTAQDRWRRRSPHALRAVPLRGECCRTHRSAPPPVGRSPVRMLLG